MNQSFIQYRIVILISILLLIIAPIASGVIPLNGSTYNAIQKYNQAVDAADNRSFEDALRLSDEAITLQPNFTLALVTKAGVLIELQRLDDASKAIDQALTLEPDNPSVLANAASLMVNMKKYDQALTYADKALTKDSNMTEALISKGTAYGGLGEYQKEIDVSDMAIRIDPENKLAKINKDYAMSHLSGKETTKDTKPETKSPMSPVVLILALCGAGLLLFRKN